MLLSKGVWAPAGIITHHLFAFGFALFVQQLHREPIPKRRCCNRAGRNRRCRYFCCHRDQNYTRLPVVRIRYWPGKMRGQMPLRKRAQLLCEIPGRRLPVRLGQIGCFFHGQNPGDGICLLLRSIKTTGKRVVLLCVYVLNQREKSTND